MAFKTLKAKGRWNGHSHQLVTEALVKYNLQCLLLRPKRLEMVYFEHIFSYFLLNRVNLQNFNIVLPLQCQPIILSSSYLNSLSGFCSLSAHCHGYCCFTSFMNLNQEIDFKLYYRKVKLKMYNEVLNILVDYLNFLQVCVLDLRKQRYQLEAMDRL